MAFVVYLVPCIPANSLCAHSFDDSRGEDRDRHCFHYHHAYLPLSHSSETVPFLREVENKKSTDNHSRCRFPAGSPHFPRRMRGSSAVARSRFNATDLYIGDDIGNYSDNKKRINNYINSESQTRTVEIPVTCYELVGVREQAEKDEIVKSVNDLMDAEIEEGYTMDAVASRQNLLEDVKIKLLFEPEYAGNISENVPPKASLSIRWAWLPGALWVLQEVGEEKLVLDIGRAALQHPDARPYVHDLLLSMALAECAIATVAFEKNNIFQGFEALGRARCLLRRKTSLEKLKLLTKIEESLKEFAPSCTLELLGMPNTLENDERRLGAIEALRELLRQGLDVEASCQVQDWPCFLNQALEKLMATEIVNLLPWDKLALTRKNKKSLESQNQRAVIDFICFRMALTAHIALGFSSKQTEMISKGRTICECLMASEGIDLQFQATFCSFLLGQANEAEAVERLQQLELNANSALRNLVSGMHVKDTSRANPSLETWLKDNVLSLFPDTRDYSPSLVNFFSGEKKASGNRLIRGSPKTVSNISLRPLTPALAPDRRALEESLAHTNSSIHLGAAVKQLAPSDLLIASKTKDKSNVNISSVQLKRNLGGHHDKIWENWFNLNNLVGRITFVAALGCIIFAALKLSALQFWTVSTSPRWASDKSATETSSSRWTVDSSPERSLGPACMEGNSMSYKLNKLLSRLTLRFRNHPDAAKLQNSCLSSSLSSSVTAVYKQLMPFEEAEYLVKQWQAIKAEALGPNHKVNTLCQVLDGPMLIQWQDLADAAKARSCFWRFVLLQLSVIRAEILSHGVGAEMAEIEVLVEEAAELVEESQLKNPNYYSTYKIRYVLKRQDDDSWRFCEGEILTP